MLRLCFKTIAAGSKTCRIFSFMWHRQPPSAVQRYVSFHPDDRATHTRSCERVCMSESPCVSFLTQSPRILSHLVIQGDLTLLAGSRGLCLAVIAFAV